MFWNEKAECMEKEEKEKIQLERLQETVKLAYENVEFYKKRFDEIGLKPEDIKTLKDIEKIPSLLWFQFSFRMHRGKFDFKKSPVPSSKGSI